MLITKCPDLEVRFAREEDLEKLLKINDLNDSFFHGANPFSYSLTLVNKKLLTLFLYSGKIVAATEILKITNEQLERIRNSESINVVREDVNSGNIVFMNNIWISTDFRVDNPFKYKSCLEFVHCGLIKLLGKIDLVGIRRNKRVFYYKYVDRKDKEGETIWVAVAVGT